MTQRLLTLFSSLFLAFYLFNTGIGLAATADKKTPEVLLSDGLNCLKKHDFACAQLTLAKIPSQSAYAKILDGSIGVTQNDVDRAFRLLLPLQADSTITPTASASLHASLALAYEQQSDPLRALEQRVTAETYLSDPSSIQNLQSQTWQALTKLSKDTLVEMRGDSLDTTMQGWIDLILAANTYPQNAQNIINWRNAYPDHPASPTIAEMLISKLSINTPATSAPYTAVSTNNTGQIALILPYLVESFYSASDSIERGFMAAQAEDKGTSAVKTYGSSGKPEEITALYQQAITDGAQYVVGPLTKDEVSALTNTNLSVPTLVLNIPEGLKQAKNQYAYGLSIDNEAQQIVKTARSLGMQTATVILVDDSLENRMTKAFTDAWTADGGQIKLQMAINPTTDLNTIKSDISTTPSDMIFLAATAENARSLRPYLDAATPTFSLSHIFAGIPSNPDDAPLTGIRFMDMPWVLDSNHDAFPAYVKASSELAPGELQRWFALGVDAYKLITLIGQHPTQTVSFRGLTGRVKLEPTGEISRELAIASFGKDNIVLEKSP
ncbi:penicillin-binding protein activator [Methyloradius palustris]|uniref:Penicillin-binding protein activator n=1 Tax=Methyloradius palustris TaxID=2778876 RepID=A0A8D5K1M5_9PROT|nr:penicillin-binding protein activator [Methyloradius palustris]BCM25903.1 penicillin-binding protein activator [Methyloradius palustris]